MCRSRSYPTAFGRAVGELVLKNMPPAACGQPLPKCDDAAQFPDVLQSLLPKPGDDLWLDAGMPDVVRYLVSSKHLNLSTEHRRLVHSAFQHV